MHKAVIDKDDHKTRTCIHDKRRYADTYYITHYGHLHTKLGIVKVQELLLVAKQFPLPHQRHRLRQYGGIRRALYAEVQCIYEEWVKYCVYQHREDGDIHRHTRFAGRAHHSVESQIQMSDGITQEDYNHILTGIRQGGIAGTEETQYGVNEQQSHATEQHTYDDIQHHAVAQDTVGYVIVALSQLHTEECRRAHAYGCTECRREVHEREGDGQSGYSQGTHALTYKDTVHHII